MTDDARPTLADDEAKLAQYAEQLGDAFALVAADWLWRMVDARSPGLSPPPDAVAELDAAAQATVAELHHLLQMDIADQPVGPLEILRRAVRFPTKLLASSGAAATPRDDFSTANFPDDVYDLTPASFSAVDPSLHEPGLMWGAAKAHVHLRRRRDRVEHAAPPAAAPGDSRVVALSADLMDRSKISGAYPAAVLVRSVAKLLDEAASATLVFVDLGRVDDPADLAPIANKVVAFGSHVNEETLASAEAIGATALPRSVFFRRLENGDF